ncbi:type I restriction-modification system subunit M [Porcipelethomonas ammoniilytica]|uniref:type I restriction-modification system subunit M n=1 Tax=Porcipelethomonas ammoniilytica TaxID=2981722 RepID=UPI0008216057|nr:type I restriction-modification system subunit M [Porcipelethomonas ammoniilytica]MCU6719444.1 type I restriction-modification system subunit M [Porcipelethomonas ammoniilytica]SCI80859.1 Type I restriction enzyme EcoKI M protein [uncultured Ruminococcus sp.]
MNKQQLAAKIWESANKMRSKIEANEYKDYILGFIFYKFLSEKEVKYLKENDWTDEYLPELTEEDTETLESVQKNLGYFISYENLFSTWIEKGRDFSVQDVRDALSAFSRLINPTHKKVFEGVFDTLQTGLSKLGDSSASQSKAISDLIHLIKDIPMDGKQDYDVLGFIYEYLISMFAANAGKKAGEFYTPHEVSMLMSEIVADHLKDRDEIKIYDPTSGSGSLLINIGKSAAKFIENENNIKYYAQELKQNTYNLTRMNLIMRGILPDNIVTRNGDTLENDWPYFDENDPIGTYDPLYVDAVVSNPPYSQAWNPEDKETDPRYARFGLAPKGKADYAFLLHDLFHIKSDGIMTIVLPHGVLFRGGEEGEIRKNLIEQNHIDAIIGLPANIFFGTGIPTIIMVLKQKRTNTDVLIVDASKGFIKVGKNNKLRASDIKRIVDVVTKRESVEKFSKVVSRDEIRNNEYNLNIPRYVDSSEASESWDIYASMFGGIPWSEIDELKEYWHAFPSLKSALFENTSSDYCKLTATDIKKVIKDHNDIQSFENNYYAVFNGFDQYLYDELIDKMDTLNISKTEAVLSLNIFERLKNIPLVDKYEAYQLLDDDWTKLAVDLEMIQTEGFEATKKVDPNMVVKKKDGKEQEVQEGWVGRIIPFDLIQDTLLADDKVALKEKENRLSEIASEYEELFESLTEEEKEGDYASEGGFVNAEIKKALKSDSIEPETKEKLLKAAALNTEEKSLKAAIKKETRLLEVKTKDTIEGLSDTQVIELLKAKWIQPLIQSLMKLPDRIVNELVSKLETLAKKYETTFAEVETEIADTQAALSAMIDELEGSDSDMLGLQEFKKMLGGFAK